MVVCEEVKIKPPILLEFLDAVCEMDNVHFTYKLLDVIRERIKYRACRGRLCGVKWWLTS